MFKANPSKSMSDHITSMHKGKSKRGMFGKKDKMKKKGKFSFFKKKTDSDHDDM